MSDIRGVSQSVVKIDPEIMSGAPCFAGTRVPIQNLIDYLEGGDSIEDFPSGEGMLRLLQMNGFQSAKAEPLTAGIVTVYTAEKDHQEDH